MKLDKILENKSEQMKPLWKLVTEQDCQDDTDDVLPEHVNTKQQPLAVCDRISKEQTFRNQFVCLTY